MLNCQSPFTYVVVAYSAHQTKIYLLHNALFNHSLRDHKFNDERMCTHQVHSLEARIFHIHCGKKLCSHCEILEVLDSCRRKSIYGQGIKTAALKPLGKIAGVADGEIDHCGREHHDISVNILAARGFVNMPAGLSVHIYIAFPQCAECNRHSTRQHSIQSAAVFEKEPAVLIGFVNVPPCIGCLRGKQCVGFGVVGHRLHRFIQLARLCVQVCHKQKRSFSDKGLVPVRDVSIRAFSPAVFGAGGIIGDAPAVAEPFCPGDLAVFAKVLYAAQ